MSETQSLGRRSGASKAAHRRNAGTLLLMTPSEQPCAIEIFTGKIAAAMQACDPAAGYEVLPVSRRWRDLPATLRRVAQSRRIVFNLPLVAWKRMLSIPLAILLFAALARRPVGVFMHEWAGLHPLRRLVLIPFLILAHRIIILSPYIRDQLAGDVWLGWTARKSRLVPHPPTICRPERTIVTDRVRHLEAAARTSDIVIGYFGSLYSGKAPTVLLDVCDELRRRGSRALIVFIGNFTRSLDDYETRFRRRVGELGLQNQVIVTGYVDTEGELYALFERIGVFLFWFPEGLTARRSSVIACLQSCRPVVVPAPPSPDEFAHHPGFTALIDSGAITFVAPTADISAIADRLIAAAKTADRTISFDQSAWWNDTTATIAAGL